MLSYRRTYDSRSFESKIFLLLVWVRLYRHYWKLGYARLVNSESTVILNYLIVSFMFTFYI